MATPFDAPAVRVIPFRVIKDFNYTECRSAIYLEEVLAPFRVLRDAVDDRPINRAPTKPEWPNGKSRMNRNIRDTFPALSLLHHC